MERHEHASRRTGRITASLVGEIVNRTSSAETNDRIWSNIIKALWLADGSEFTVETTGARAHGHRVEPITISHFWNAHPELEILDPYFVEGEHTSIAQRVPELAPYASYLGCSPDAFVRYDDPNMSAGLEAKSPVNEEVFRDYQADCARGIIPVRHRDQVYFSMLLTAEPWFFVAQRNGEYCESYADLKSEGFLKWKERSVPVLVAFMKLYVDGTETKRTKLSKNMLDLI